MGDAAGGYLLSTALRTAKLQGENFVSSSKGSQHFQLRRKNDQIRLCSNCDMGFRFKTNCSRGVVRRHCDYFVERQTGIVHECSDKIDHARGTARQRRMVSE